MTHPDPVMADLVNKVMDDVAAATDRTVSLLDDPNDRFAIATAGAVASIGCAIAAFVEANPGYDKQDVVPALFDVLREMAEGAIPR